MGCVVGGTAARNGVRKGGDMGVWCGVLQLETELVKVGIWGCGGGYCSSKRS